MTIVYVIRKSRDKENILNVIIKLHITHSIISCYALPNPACQAKIKLRNNTFGMNLKIVSFCTIF